MEIRYPVHQDHVKRMTTDELRANFHNGHRQLHLHLGHGRRKSGFHRYEPGADGVAALVRPLGVKWGDHTEQQSLLCQPR